MASSRGSSRSQGWHEQILRQKYNDPRRLKEYLDEAYGPGNYLVKTKSNRWILCLPEPMNQVPDSLLFSSTSSTTGSLSLTPFSEQGDMDSLEQHVQFHYDQG
jgi:hypothetical protein